MFGVCLYACVVDERVSRCFCLSFRYVGVISPAESTGSMYIECRWFQCGRSEIKSMGGEGLLCFSSEYVTVAQVSLLFFVSLGTAHSCS